MPKADELHWLSASLAIWRAYDSLSRVELFSTALVVEEHLYPIDPIELAAEARHELERRGKICGVFITNGNHLRAAEKFSANGAALFCSATTASANLEREMIAIFHHDRIADRIEVIALDGGAEGELALFVEGDGGTIIVGDALIYLAPNELSLLPAKYCQDQKQLCRSLGQLLDFSFARLLFAHGEPIVAGARGKLEALLVSR